ncbi:hypothetical protein [Haloarchaeobius iranensis]|uniref:Uncharacterized protein n=1 Tax=Haloarchaeobius iranensis TaxID=996166 RepID=A0A1G9SX10_9EURY|nr:hypothetical protein [Haloarchaeobius iranensis]SDM39952.1 hypothetical protein SAMN05192554_10211 [Haloarchaeobius iranensis]
MADLGYAGSLPTLTEMAVDVVDGDMGPCLRRSSTRPTSTPSYGRSTPSPGFGVARTSTGDLVDALSSGGEPEQWFAVADGEVVQSTGAVRSYQKPLSTSSSVPVSTPQSSLVLIAIAALPSNAVPRRQALAKFFYSNRFEFDTQ